MRGSCAVNCWRPMAEHFEGRPADLIAWQAVHQAIGHVRGLKEAAAALNRPDVTVPAATAGEWSEQPQSGTGSASPTSPVTADRAQDLSGERPAGDAVATMAPDDWMEPACRVCGCTADRACPGGCTWVPDPAGKGDLCSRCLPE